MQALALVAWTALKRQAPTHIEWEEPQDYSYTFSSVELEDNELSMRDEYGTWIEADISDPHRMRVTYGRYTEGFELEMQGGEYRTSDFRPGHTEESYRIRFEGDFVRLYPVDGSGEEYVFEVH